VAVEGWKHRVRRLKESSVERRAETHPYPENPCPACGRKAGERRSYGQDLEAATELGLHSFATRQARDAWVKEAQGRKAILAKDRYLRWWMEHFGVEAVTHHRK